MDGTLGGNDDRVCLGIPAHRVRDGSRYARAVCEEGSKEGTCTEGSSAEGTCGSAVHRIRSTEGSSAEGSSALPISKEHTCGFAKGTCGSTYGFACGFAKGTYGFALRVLTETQRVHSPQDAMGTLY